MGNKLVSLLSESWKNYKDPNEFVDSKLISNDDDVFLTPKSFLSVSEEPEDYQDHRHKTPEVSQFLDSETDTDSSIFVCEICVERKLLDDSFNFKGCSHFYCTQCTVRYVASKLDDNVVHISCPVSDCEGVLDPEFCRHILPKDMFDRWGIALCESVIDGSQKFYCPYMNCSALLINDTAMEVEDTEESTECPVCKREFCVKCEVPWHSELSCEKFQKLKKKGGDSMLIDLAKRKNWRRCPKCKFYVERSVGCYYMQCRCGYAFCYQCGTRSNTTNHNCSKCTITWYF